MNSSLRRACVLVLGVVLVACAAAGEEEDTTAPNSTAPSGGSSATTVPSGATTSTNGSGGENPGGNQPEDTVRFEMSGNFDVDGQWDFLAVSSSYVDGVWWLTFVPDADDLTGGSAVTVQSVEDGAVGFLSPDAVMAASGDACEIDVDHSDGNGTSGSFDCQDVIVYQTDGSARDGVRFRGTWRTGG